MLRGLSDNLLGVCVLLAVVKTFHATLPQTSIYCISITPTPCQWKPWPIVREANLLIQSYAETDRRLNLIDLINTILGPDGKPDRSLFRIDRLHPNKKEYANWTATVKPILQSDLSKDALEIKS